jgi:uncharacterized membrane protein
MEFFIVVVFVIFIVFIAIFQVKSHEKRITKKVHTIGGEVISIKRKTFSTGPFLAVGKGRTVYRIEYRIGNEIKEGWVKFGSLSGPDWRL